MRRSLLAPAALVAAAALVAVSAPTIAAAATLEGTNAVAAEVDGGETTRVIPIAGAGAVDDVTITIDFLKTDGSCAAPAGGDAYHDEIRFALQSPAGTTVDLVPYGTFAGDSAMSPISLTLDDAAATQVGGGTPAAGTFRPVGALSTFDGEPAAGDWTLTVGDSVGEDPLCFTRASLTVDTSELALSGATLPTARLGEAYATAIVADSGAAPIAYALAEGSALPAGLTLATDGTLAGTPTEHGEFAFDVIASNAGGAAAPATFELDVLAPPTIEGAATAIAQIGVPFTYTPTVDPGTPVSFFGVRGLPTWAAVNPYTGEIWGTPTGTLGDFVGTYETYYGTEPDPEHTVVITVVAGAASELFLTPEHSTVDQGGSVTFAVAATDVEGNPVDVSDRTVLSSSVATDVVDGLVVTFPTASSHVITVTDTVTGVTDSAVVDVVPTAPGAAQGTLPQTGGEVVGWLGALAALLLAAGAVLLGRRRA